MQRALAAFLITAAFCLVAAPSRAQLDSREAIQLQNQMAELRRDLSALRDQINHGGGSNLGGRPAPVMAPQLGSGDLNTALLGRIGQLEEQVRRLQGQVDEGENARQRDGDALRKSIDDMNFKLGNAPATPAPARPPAANAATTPPAPPANAVRRTPELALQEGNAALARRDYGAAEAAAKEVLGFPKSPRAYDGQFLLAQAQAGRRDFGAAAVAYDDTYNRSRNGGHAQDALLGLANSLVALNEKRAACATLDKMRAEFATPRADLKDHIASARTKAGCR
jgi:TolA-binding protein